MEECVTGDASSGNGGESLLEILYRAVSGPLSQYGGCPIHHTEIFLRKKEEERDCYWIYSPANNSITVILWRKVSQLRNEKEKEKGKLVLITSHVLSDLDDLVSQVIYMQDGKCCFHKSIEEIKIETKQDKLAKAIASLMAK